MREKHESGPVRGRNNHSPRLKPWGKVAVQKALERATQTPHMLFRPVQGSVVRLCHPRLKRWAFALYSPLVCLEVRGGSGSCKRPVAVGRSCAPWRSFETPPRSWISSRDPSPDRTRTVTRAGLNQRVLGLGGLFYDWRGGEPAVTPKALVRSFWKPKPP